MSLHQDLAFAVQLARGAGKVILQHYGHVERLTKTHAAASAEAVTIADRASQRHIVAAIRRQYPQDGIIGEESDAGDAITAEIRDPNARNWVIDPIDGTNNFIAQLGNFAVCIGLMIAGRPVMGVVYDVTRDAMYAGGEGIGARLDGKPIAVRDVPMSDASVVMLTSNLLNKQKQCPGWAVRWLSQTNWKLRMLGSAALEAVQVASGAAAASVTVHGKLWDIAAPAAVVLAAGGRIVGLDGSEIFPYRLDGYLGAKVPFISAAPQAVDAILADLKAYP